MTVDERLRLIELLWQSLDEEEEEKYVDEEEGETEEELNILRERWAEYEANPDNTISMEEFKERWAKKKNGGKKI